MSASALVCGIMLSTRAHAFTVHKHRVCPALRALYVSTTGSFLEASAQSVEAATLAAATLELMRCGRVHSHPEPFVRRAALLAAGHVLGAVPPARVAAAMLTAAAGGGSGTGWPAAAAASDVAEEALVSRLEWLREWVEGVASHDTDDSCRRVSHVPLRA
jgi:telomere length regulation protein